MKKNQPQSYYRSMLDQHSIEFDELDRQIREALRPLSGLTYSQVVTIERQLKPKTDRIAVLRRQMAACKRELQ